MRSSRVVHLLLLVGLLIVAFHAIARPAGTTANVVSNLLLTMLPCLAAVLCFRTARIAREDRHSWILFGAACSSWFIGQLIWNSYALGLLGQPAFPSPAEFAWGLFYPIFFTGFVLRLRRAGGMLPPRAAILDSLILVCATALIVNEVILSSIGGAATDWPTSVMVTVSWEFGTLMLVMLIAIALVVHTSNVIRGPLGLLIVSFLTLTVTDIIYNHQALNDAYVYGTALDLGWYATFLGIGLAAAVAPQFGDVANADSAADHERTASLMRAGLMVASVLGTTGMSAYIAWQPEASTPMIAIVVVSGVLLATRLGIAAIQTDRLARRTRERDRLAAVVSASNAMSATLELDQILPLLAQAAANAVGRERAEVYVFTEDLETIEQNTVFGFPPEQAACIQPTGDVSIDVFPAKHEIIATLRPVSQSTDHPGLPPDVAACFREIGKHHMLVTPLIAHGRVVGVFDTWTPYDTTPFDPADIAAATAIGQQAGMAIYNARLLARTRQHATEQEALLRVSQAAVSSLDLATVLDQIAHASLGVARAEACAIEIWNPEDRSTTLAAEATIEDWPGTSPVGTLISFDDWPTSERVLNEQRTLNLLSTDDVFTPYEQAHLLADDTNSILMVPLIIDDKSIGILNLFSRKRRTFTPDEVRIATDLAAQVAIAIDRARLHEALRERADTDGLTGVLNHRAILETLDSELARTRRGGPPLSVVMIDLDGFKSVNDTHGHQTGDQMLQRTAAFLQSSIREVDAIGRYGGDEFLLVLPNTGADDARLLISRLLDLAEDAMIVVDGLRLPLNLSAGVATTPDDGLLAQKLLAGADARMYEAKFARRWITASAGD